MSRLEPRLSLVVSSLAICALGALLQACAHRPPVTAPSRPSEVAAVHVQVGQRVEMVALEEYVAGCVAAELGSINLAPAAAARARDVQAILCRSYAVTSVGRHAAEGFDLCSTTHCQAFRPVPATAIGRLCREAAARTAGRVLRANGQAVRPAYHADCGGHTTTPDEVWGGDSPSFFVSAADDACPRRAPWRLEVALSRLEDILRADPSIAFDGPLRDLTVERRDRSGRAAWVRLTGGRSLLIRGVDFRSAVDRALGPMSLPSTLFTVVRRAKVVRFEGRGNGHGVGLCQAGLIARAGRGDTPALILAHYFPGTTVGPR